MDLNTKLATIYFNGLNLKSDFLYMHLCHITQMKYVARDLNISTLCFKDFFHYMFHYSLNGLEHIFLLCFFFLQKCFSGSHTDALEILPVLPNFPFFSVCK